MLVTMNYPPQLINQDLLHHGTNTITFPRRRACNSGSQCTKPESLLRLVLPDFFRVTICYRSEKYGDGTATRTPGFYSILFPRKLPIRLGVCIFLFSFCTFIITAGIPIHSRLQLLIHHVQNSSNYCLHLLLSHIFL